MYFKAENKKTFSQIPMAKHDHFFLASPIPTQFMIRIEYKTCCLGKVKKLLASTRCYIGHCLPSLYSDPFFTV